MLTTKRSHDATGAFIGLSGETFHPDIFLVKVDLILTFCSFDSQGQHSWIEHVAFKQVTAEHQHLSKHLFTLCLQFLNETCLQIKQKSSFIRQFYAKEKMS